MNNLDQKNDKAKILVVSLSPAIDRNYRVKSFEAGQLQRISNPLISPGGKGINVAKVLKSLGATATTTVTVTGIFGGANGNYIIQELEKMGISTRPVLVKEETRSSINIYEENRARETELLEEGPYVTDRELDLISQIIKDFCVSVMPGHKKDKPSSVSYPVPHIIFSGSLPQGLKVDSYHRLIKEANELGAICFLDSSGQALIEGIKASPFFIKPNIREFKQIFGQDISFEESINEESIRNLWEIVKDRKPKIPVVALTLGDRGAIVFTKDQCLYSRALPIKPVNTIGSGDSFVAGFVSAIARGQDLKKSLRLAMACATSNALYDEVGVVDLEEVEAFKAHVEILELD